MIKGHIRSWKDKEGHGRSGKVEGHGWSFPITGLTFQVRKVMGGWVMVAYRVILLLFCKENFLPLIILKSPKINPPKIGKMILQKRLVP